MSNTVDVLLKNLKRMDVSIYEFAKKTGIPKSRVYQSLINRKKKKVALYTVVNILKL